MSPPPALETWLPYRRPNPAARIRLVCLPFAGGGASTYRLWPDGLPLTADVCAVQPPGRETRFREPPYDRLKPLVRDVADALRPLFDLPVVIFGHSLGALIAFELAREMCRRGGPVAAGVIPSGRRAPHVPPQRPPLHALPDEEFRAELKKLDGTSPAILDNDELMRVLLPALRADFAAHETYEYVEAPPLGCPILTVTGADDKLAPPAVLEGWRRHTTGQFESAVLPGNHFFVQTKRTQLLQRIALFLEPLE
jgi:medium-chain acyl-[acyl-carrier-protein] hydrolase